MCIRDRYKTVPTIPELVEPKETPVARGKLAESSLLIDEPLVNEPIPPDIKPKSKVLFHVTPLPNLKVNAPYKVKRCAETIKFAPKFTYAEELEQLDFKTFEERKMALVK
eukprot:TRINITY_DN10339_c0_g1_i4.p2 TRINITY_DN10339_c0_g1~~TRINITY_DN10339_c0_g1_i4.p2  ORF type:complete len:110 (+),score=29.29 TRINITY_DN10339_c0_g1_i4:67-396(+)